MLPVTDLQYQLLQVLWARGEASVSEVHGALAVARDLAPTTVATLLSRLEKRGLVTHHTEGRRHVYRATVDEASLQREILDSVATGVFGGDVTALVCQLLDARGVAPGDLERVRRLIESMEPESPDDV